MKNLIFLFMLIFGFSNYSLAQQSARGANKYTYRAATNSFALATNPTDAVTLFGSASKTVKITKISINGIQTTASQVNVSVVKRSTTNSGGTSTALTVVPSDSANPASTATNVLLYSANPASLGTTVGSILTDRIYFGTATSTSDRFYLDLVNEYSQPIILRGTTQGIAVNFGGASITGGSIMTTIEWTEE